MKYNMIDLSYIYRTYRLVDDMLNRLESMSSDNAHQTKHLREIQKLDIQGKYVSFDAKVFNVRNTIQVWVDTLRELTNRVSIGYTLTHYPTRLLMNIKLRRTVLRTINVMISDVVSRLDMLDGGLDNNDHYKEMIKIGSERISKPKAKLGFGS